MRVAGAIVGGLVLGTFVIPGSSTPNIGSFSARSAPQSGPEAGAPERTGSATLAGRVYGPGGRPLEGAEISLAGSGFWPPRVIRSGAEGRFFWPHVPAGIYELQATHGDLASPPLEGLILDPGSRRVFGLRLVEGWTLSGRVIQASDGQPIADAQIRVAAGVLGARARDTRSDAQGRFAVEGVVQGTQNVYVEAPGYVPLGPIVVSKEGPDIEAMLERGATLEGIVVDPRGRPIDGAIVRAFGAGSSVVRIPGAGVTVGPVPPISASGTTELAVAEQVMTGPSGQFQLSSLPAGSYNAVATHPRYAPGESESFSLRAGRIEAEVRIVLQPGAELRGRVLDARDRGLAGIPVELRIARERLPRMTVSGDDGAFAFRGVRGEVTVTALPYDLQPVSETLTLTEQRRAEVTLTLASELLTLRGQVVDERGYGVEGAVITATADVAGTSIRRSAKTDADGSFAIPALPDPPYDLDVEHPVYSATTVRDVQETENVEVVVAAGVSLRGKIIDDWSGDGLEGARVLLRGPVDLTGRTRRDGSFEIPRASVGLYELEVTHPDFQPQKQRIEIEAPLYVDRPQELSPVRLNPGGTIEGEVRDAYGEPVRGAEVAWGVPPRWEKAKRTDAGGRFVLRGVPGGAVWIAARHPEAGESFSSEPVAVRSKETSPGAYVRLPGRLEPSE